MAEIEMWLPGAIGAAISVGAATVSVVMWFRARNERREATRQAKLATDAAIAKSHATFGKARVR